MIELLKQARSALAFWVTQGGKYPVTHSSTATTIDEFLYAQGAADRINDWYARRG